MNTQFIDLLKRYDLSFFALAAMIFVIGVLNLFSGTYLDPSQLISGLYKTQILWFLVAMGAGIFISFVGTKNIYRYSYAIYFFNIILLVLVLIVGDKALGAQRWLVIGPIRIQPSEIMKVSLILALARWYSKNDPDKEIGLRQLIIPFIITLVPALLIIVEPDLGTGLMLFLIFMMITFYRKLKFKTLMILFLIGLVSGTTMYKYGLKDYQKRRIVTFLNPSEDAKGSGYNAIQSKIAIGSGKLFGKGYMKSSQASLQYLPENHTDFVFSVYNEEHGFVGSIILISLYILLLFRFIWLSGSVTKIYDSIVVIGLMSIFFWHTIINMAMVTGLLPIVGLPLPLMSYGGSSLLTFGMCCGAATCFSNSRNLF